jgi:hypothetical protein
LRRKSSTDWVRQPVTTCSNWKLPLAYVEWSAQSCPTPSPRFATLVFAHRSIEGLNKTANGSVWLAMVSDSPVPAVLLGQSASVYAERPTFAPLRRHFASTWFHRVPQDRPHSTLVVPDGCVDLLWARGSLRIAGPDREAKLEAIPAGTTVVGLRFQPGAAAAWLRIATSEIVDARAARRILGR